jgi:MYXO-CTERM domain-containing protein
VGGCTDDFGVPPVADDLSTPPVSPPSDLSAAVVSLSGGGGCAVDGASHASPRALVLVAAFFFVGLALRRRRSA